MSIATTRPKSSGHPTWTLIRWPGAGIKLLFRIGVVTWTTLAIYYSNPPWPELRLGLAMAFLAFASLAIWLSCQRQMPAMAFALVLGVIAWWLTITSASRKLPTSVVSTN